MVPMQAKRCSRVGLSLFHDACMLFSHRSQAEAGCMTLAVPLLQLEGAMNGAAIITHTDMLHCIPRKQSANSRLGKFSFKALNTSGCILRPLHEIGGKPNEMHDAILSTYLSLCCRHGGRRRNGSGVCTN